MAMDSSMGHKVCVCVRARWVCVCDSHAVAATRRPCTWSVRESASAPGTPRRRTTPPPPRPAHSPLSSHRLPPRPHHPRETRASTRWNKQTRHEHEYLTGKKSRDTANLYQEDIKKSIKVLR